MEVELLQPRPVSATSAIRPHTNTLIGVGIVACLVLAIWLRFWNISTQAFWHDELYTMANVNALDIYTFKDADFSEFESPRVASEVVQKLGEHKFAATWFRNIVHEGHPPLYGLLLKGWALIFGDTEMGLRSFSATMSVLTLIPLYLMASRLGGRTAAFFTITLFAVAPFHVYFAQEARSYALTILLCALASWATVELVCKEYRGGSGIWWGMWCISATAAMYTHFYAAIYCGLLTPFIWMANPGVGKIRKVVGLSLPFGLLSLWLPVLRMQMKAQSDHWTNGSTGVTTAIIGFMQTIKEMVSGVGTESTAEVTIGALVLLIAIAAGLFRSNRRIRLATCYAIGLLIVHSIIVYALDVLLNHHMIMVPRFSIGLAVVLPILLGVGLSRLGPKGIAVGLVLICVSVFACIESSTGRRAPKQMFFQLAGFLNANVKGGEPVFITPSGPTLLGVARIVHPGMVLAACPANQARTIANEAAKQAGTAWIVEQRLGIVIEAWKLDASSAVPPKGDVTRFAGMDVRRVTPE